MQKIIFFLYSIVLSLWTGGIFIFMFIVTPVIFRSYGRDMAGEIVGRLFPAYFLFNLTVSILALILIVLLSGMISGIHSKISYVLIISALLINVFVIFKLHPDIRKIKNEIGSFESAPPDSPSRITFRKLHAVSATLNIVLLAEGVTLLVISNLVRK